MYNEIRRAAVQKICIYSKNNACILALYMLL